MGCSIGCALSSHVRGWLIESVPGKQAWPLWAMCKIPLSDQHKGACNNYHDVAQLSVRPAFSWHFNSVIQHTSLPFAREAPENSANAFSVESQYPK